MLKSEDWADGIIVEWFSIILWAFQELALGILLDMEVWRVSDP